MKGAKARMRTSATGTAEGFTLVELMVVLVIVGLVSAAVVLAMPDPRGALRGEALRLAARADAARERAMMDNRPVALVIRDQGYGFEWRSEAEHRQSDQHLDQRKALLFRGGHGLAPRR